ncbi:Nudix hydrolase 9, partial [Linum grandiflorum]
GRLRFLPFFHVFPLPNEIAIVRRDSDDKREINQLGSELFRPISSNRLPAFCSMTTMEEPPPPPPEYKLLLSCPSGLLSSQLSVVFDRSYDRVALPNSELEDSIAQIWEERVQRNSSLYNGKKFRYGGYSVPDGGVAGGVVTHACLHLGLTDYRTFIGTNLNPLWENFLAPSEDDATLCQHTASPLGNGAIVVTSDNEIVVLRRSENVGEFPGYFVFPGGHPENVQPGQIEASSATDVIRNEDLNKKVSEEMFDSISREVVEEIGVPATSLVSSSIILKSRPFRSCNTIDFTVPFSRSVAVQSNFYRSLPQEPERQTSCFFLHELQPPIERNPSTVLLRARRVRVDPTSHRLVGQFHFSLNRSFICYNL